MELLATIRGGLPVPSERITVEQFLNTWLTIHKPSVRPSTFACYQANVRTHLVPAIGRIKLAKLTPRDVQRMMADMTDKGSSPRTVQLARTILRTALQRGVEWGDVPRNVADLVRGPRVEREAVNPWTVEECDQFLEHVAGDRLEALYICALTLGLRQGELLGLRWGRTLTSRTATYGSPRPAHGLPTR